MRIPLSLGSNSHSPAPLSPILLSAPPLPPRPPHLPIPQEEALLNAPPLPPRPPQLPIPQEEVLFNAPPLPPRPPGFRLPQEEEGQDIRSVQARGRLGEDGGMARGGGGDVHRQLMAQASSISNPLYDTIT